MIAVRTSRLEGFDQVDVFVVVAVVLVRQHSGTLDGGLDSSPLGHGP